MKTLFSILLLTIPTLLFAQKGRLAAYEDSLIRSMRDMSNAATDEEKLAYNKDFVRQLKHALQYKDAFDYPFDSLVRVVKILVPEDNTFRLFNWAIMHNDYTFTYYGMVLKSKKEGGKLIELTDKSAEIEEPENRQLLNDMWYGAYYNRIITTTESGKTYYTLLGWDGNDRLTAKRIIDVMSFSGNTGLRFGAKMFVFKKEVKYRVVLEYAATAQMTLAYNPKDNLIVFDHLEPANLTKYDNPDFSPSGPGTQHLKGSASFYVPSGAFDALRYEEGKWVLIGEKETINLDNLDESYQEKVKDIYVDTSPDSNNRKERKKAAEKLKKEQEKKKVQDGLKPE